MKKIILLLLVSFSTIGQIDTTKTPYEQIQDFAKTWIGRKYKLGGNTAKGIDCSQLTKKFYKEVFNINIGNNAQAQWRQAKKISPLAAQPGDIMFFKSPDSPTGWHCGIYIGDERFLHAANRAEGVKISSTEEPKYIKRLRGYGRIE